MKRIIVLNIFLIVLLGCASRYARTTDNVTFSGSSFNWSAEVKFTYEEKIESPKKGIYVHKNRVTHYQNINYIGPKEVKKVEYQYSWNNGSSKSSGIATFDREPYHIGGGGSGGGTSSEKTAKEAKNIKVGDYKYGFPSKDDVILLTIKWDGKEEVIELKARY